MNITQNNQSHPAFQANLIGGPNVELFLDRKLVYGSFKSLQKAVKQQTNGLRGTFRLDVCDQKSLKFSYINEKGDVFSGGSQFASKTKVADLHAAIHNDGRGKPYNGAVRTLVAQASDAVGATKVGYTEKNKPFSFLKNILQG